MNWNELTGRFRTNPYQNIEGGEYKEPRYCEDIFKHCGAYIKGSPQQFEEGYGWVYKFTPPYILAEKSGDKVL